MTKKTFGQWVIAHRGDDEALNLACLGLGIAAPTGTTAKLTAIANKLADPTTPNRLPDLDAVAPPPTPPVAPVAPVTPPAPPTPPAPTTPPAPVEPPPVEKAPCRSCGWPNPLDAVICPRCGFDPNAKPGTVTPPHGTPAVSPSGGIKVGGLIGWGIRKLQGG
jgi:hypothetical protein